MCVRERAKADSDLARRPRGREGGAGSRRTIRLRALERAHNLSRNIVGGWVTHTRAGGLLNRLLNRAFLMSEGPV